MHDMTELHKEYFGVKYFDHTTALAEMYRVNGMTLRKSFNYHSFELSTGEEINFGEREKIAIERITSLMKEGDITLDGKTIKDTLMGNKNIINKEITERKISLSDEIKQITKEAYSDSDVEDTNSVEATMRVNDFDSALFDNDTDNTVSDENDEVIDF